MNRKDKIIAIVENLFIEVLLSFFYHEHTFFIVLHIIKSPL